MRVNEIEGRIIPVVGWQLLMDWKVILASGGIEESPGREEAIRRAKEKSQERLCRRKKGKRRQGHQGGC